MCKENECLLNIERFNAYYGLEEHLKSFRDIPLYEKLCCSWEVDKQKYINNISATAQRFPHYSDHGESHSKAIISNIEFILGKKRIKQLSVADTWLLLQCAYAHDVGMSLSAKDLISQMADDEDIYNKVRDICQKDEITREAFEFIQPLFDYYLFKKREEFLGDDSDEYIAKTSLSQRLDARAQYEIFKSDDFARWPIKLVNAFTVILENYVRPRHGEFSENILTEDFAQVCENGIVPVRLRYLVARIAAFHMKDRENLLEEFPKETLGICNDYMNPRFAAIMLRLGDLLDLDNGRFSQAQLNILGSSPYVTLIHQFKHEAITHFLITPLEISVKANFTQRTAEKLLRIQKASEKNCIIKDSEKIKLCMKACKSLFEWLEMLREEIEFFSKKWLSIVPRKFDGACPSYIEPELRVDGRIINRHELGLSYEITTKRSSEIIEGSGLYAQPQFTFIREVLQNALDATKLKMYRDIMAGQYPEFYDDDFKHEEIKNLTPACFAEKIKNNINSYRIEYEIKANEADKTVGILIRDYGVGITYNDLINMQKIGNSNKTEFNKEYENMPNWLKPTGSFGIGLQSIFYVAKSFKIYSRPYFEPEHVKPPLREMVFYSARMGGEIEVSLCDNKKAEDFGYGTEVEIIIDFKNDKDKLLLYANRNNEDCYDLFCDSLEQVCNDYIDYLKQIYSNFIIPCRKKEEIKSLSLKKCERNIYKEREKNSILENTFGSFCILSEYGIIKKCSNDLSLGFSCWNGQYGILIKYKANCMADGNRNSASIYYKGIKVCSSLITKSINIPFWDVEIHLFSEYASAILEINRDEFLSEKRREIANYIHRVHFCCLNFIFNIDNINLYKKELDSIWQYKDSLGVTKKLFTAKAYFSLLMYFISNKEPKDKHLLSKFMNMCDKTYDDNLDICNIASYFVMYNNFLRRRIIDNTASFSAFCEILNNNYENIYYVASKSLPKNDLPLQYAHTLKKDNSLIILEDFLYSYPQFAACSFKVIIITGWYEPIIVYKICRRNGGIVRCDEKDYWTLCARLYYVALKNCRNSIKEQQFRLVFPSKIDFEKISVSKLILGIEHKEITKFDSYIISPLSLYELKTLVELCASSTIEEGLNKYFSENWIDKNRILINHINKYNTINRNPKSCTATENECEIFLEYKRFLKTLLGEILTE